MVRHGARILALASWSVNAFACASPRVFGPGYEPGAHVAPSTEERLSPEPARLWDESIGRAAAGPVAVGDSVIASLSTDGMLTVLQRADGKIVWRRRLDSPGVGRPVLDDSLVYAASADGQVYATVLRSGRSRWSRKLGPLAGIGVDAEGRVIVTGARGLVAALEPLRGAVMWRQDLHLAIRTRPTMATTGVIVATDDSLFLLDGSDGRVVHRAESRGIGPNPPVVADELVIVASALGTLEARTAASLGLAWRVKATEPIVASTAVARDTAFALTIGGTLISVPLRDPSGVARTPLGVAIKAPPVPLANGMLVATVAGEVLWITPPDSIPRWKNRVDGPVDQAPVVSHGLLVFIDGRGRIQAWK